MPLGSSPNETCSRGGLPLLLFSPLLSLSKERPLLGWDYLACQLPPAPAWLPSLGQDHDFMAPGEEHVQALSCWYEL